MKWAYIFSIGFIILASFSASVKSKQAHFFYVQSDTIKPPPVETKMPNASYTPQFVGQTRVQGVKTKTSILVEKLNGDLGPLWGIAALPDGKFIVTNKTGFMYLLNKEGKTIAKITSLPMVDYGGQGGLLDVLADPNYNTNKTIYWSYSEKQEDKANLTAVAKGVLDEKAGTVTSIKVIFRALPYFKSGLHFGSRLVFDKSGNLFVSSGERSNVEGRKQAQWLNSGLGKIFRITREGKPSANNPFINSKQAMPEIFAYGIRNCQSLDINPATGELWEAEFGPRGGDEVNIIRAGKNYGWPTITYGLEYSGQKVGEGITQKSGMEQPVYYWDPVLSPSGMAFYAGNEIPEWKNNLFIGGLSSQHICRLVINNNKVVGEERLLADKKERFRDVLYSNGKLYAITDNGNIYCIRKEG